MLSSLMLYKWYLDSPHPNNDIQIIKINTITLFQAFFNFENSAHLIGATFEAWPIDQYTK